MAPQAARYGSDVIVELLRAHGIGHVALNPGASFRGLHDSLVNLEGGPELLLVPHEKIAVNVAHGFAKASGQPMAAILHDTVGLLHGSLGIFSALLDRAPVLVLGGAGPMDATRRRPWIDWIHTTNIQGNAVRGFTKWDDQPASVGAMPEAFARALAVARAEPAGPVYLGIDAQLQESELEGEVPFLDPERVGPATPIGPDPAGLAEAADLLLAAHRPVIVAGFAGRDPLAFEQVPRLAEQVSAAVIDTNDRLNLPNHHPLNLSGTDVVSEADLVLLLDVKDASRTLLTTDPPRRDVSSRLAAGCRIVDIGFNDRHVSSWVHDAGPVIPMDLRVTADTAVALPLLIDLIERRLAAEPLERRGERAARREALAERHLEQRRRWRAEAEARFDERPVSPPRLVAEVWEALHEHDWVLSAGTANDWALRLWDLDRSYRHPGRSQGTATQIGISLGVALAHRGTGRLVVDLQPDGDLLFDAAALWIASAHRIPMLVVMVNNRAYYNDWEHQIRIARLRGRDVARAHVGVRIADPEPDFALLARSFGWYAEGPIEEPNAVAEAVRRSARVVVDEGRPALVDIVCAHR